jgi:hypothetical protein
LTSRAAAGGSFGFIVVICKDGLKILGRAKRCAASAVLTNRPHAA